MYIYIYYTQNIYVYYGTQLLLSKAGYMHRKEPSIFHINKS